MPAARTSSSTSLPAKTEAVWIEDGLFSACPIGIDLLRQFAQARPNDYAFLQTKDFLDVGTSGTAVTSAKHKSMVPNLAHGQLRHGRKLQLCLRPLR